MEVTGKVKFIVDYLGIESDEVKLYHKNGGLALWYYKDSDGYWSESTYDENGNELTFKDSDGVTRGFDTKELTIEERLTILENKLK